MGVSWKTRLIREKPVETAQFRSLATPTFRGSTTLFERAADVRDDWDQRRSPYSYGLYGTPTSLELAARIADLEGAGHCLLTPGGQAAIALISLATTSTGGHVLLPDSAYGPGRELAATTLSRFGVEAEAYPPLIGEDIRGLLRPDTQLVWCESPGSVTMEVQDVPAIARVAREAGVVTALDNTYAAGVLFDAFAAGVDISMQALTKYVGGHSDILLGSVTTKREDLHQSLGATRRVLGLGVSPDDCSLALRGLQTLAVRLDRLESSTLHVARWLQDRPEIAQVLHPALPGSPGHENFVRDFTGSASVFSFTFRSGTAADEVLSFVDRLEIFRIGYSWGGVTSLVMPYLGLERRFGTPEGALVRLNIGLEEPEDLVDDLERALAPMRTARS